MYVRTRTSALVACFVYICNVSRTLKRTQQAGYIADGHTRTIEINLDGGNQASMEERQRTSHRPTCGLDIEPALLLFAPSTPTFPYAVINDN
jgi:hypothetical protein